MSDPSKIQIDAIAAMFERRAAFLKKDHTDRQYGDFLEGETLLLASQVRDLTSLANGLNEAIKMRPSEGLDPDASEDAPHPVVN